MQIRFLSASVIFTALVGNLAVAATPLSKADTKFLADHKPLHECYDKFTAGAGESSRQTGQLAIDITLDDQGKIQKALPVKRKSNLYDDKLNRCIVQALNGFEFPKDMGGAKKVTALLQFPLVPAK